ncbi:hypothetical protein FJO69_02595 [[Mycoplasma] falconis]|uniref:S1 motif domain-containing protein n=1 Tax=[Mycoplasma] falconis TaxID=92403 RepID=A0A501X9E1_9BACT|nr:hypothetical protein [[Mycoplasma] falconis]TPE56977.1 hypothetical protein FJO69_02595 [[Mycoplasma] falconis]
MKEYYVGKIIRAKVVKVLKNLVILVTKENKKCYLNINEISDYYVKNLNIMFKVGDIKELIIIEVMHTGELVVSFKKIHPKEIRNPFEFKLDTKNCEFDALLDFTNKGINYGK